MTDSDMITAYKGNEPFIFVSYSHSDQLIVYKLIKQLHLDGFHIWYDEGLEPGTDWIDNTAMAIINSSCILAFVSPKAIGLHNVRNELNFALSRKKTVVCVFLEDTKLPLGLEMQLGSQIGLYYQRFSDEEKFYQRLIKSLPNQLKERDL